MRTAPAVILTIIVVAACSASSSPNPTEPVFQVPSEGPSAPLSGPVSGAPPGAGLESWAFINRDGVDASIDADGTITLVLKNRLLWFRASKGFLMYQPASGDFRVTGHVVATKTSDAGQPAGGDGSAQLGGLMARNGDSATQNYVHIVVGDDGDGPSVETKMTVDSVSTFAGPSWPTTEADLRICRVGPRFSLYKRPGVGDDWVEAAVYQRADLPAALQVGVDLYTNDQPDITLTVSAFLVEPVTSQADCTTD